MYKCAVASDYLGYRYDLSGRRKLESTVPYLPWEFECTWVEADAINWAHREANQQNSKDYLERLS